MLLLLLAVLSFHCRHTAHSHRACAKMRLLLLLAVLSFHCRHSHFARHCRDRIWRMRGCAAVADLTSDRRQAVGVMVRQ